MEAPQIITTSDGSPTLYNSQLGEHYHSVHGAVQESRHIFIEAALSHRIAQTIPTEGLRLLELGFGTGLNALMTLEALRGTDIAVHYTSLELYPVPESVYRQLSFPLEVPERDAWLQALHEAPWELEYPLPESPSFVLCKRQTDIASYTPELGLDVIYFDAFSPETQPELWCEELFARLYMASRPGAVLTTYCAKGEVRRRLARAGWQVERLPGPPGKREMLRASKKL